MTDEEIIRFCIEHRIKVEQFYFMWLISRKDFNRQEKYSYAKQYIRHVTAFNQEDIDDLVNMGLVDNFNSPGDSLPEMYVIKDEILKEFQAGEDAGDELWNAYPPNFPLSNGGSFIARAGMDKDDLIALYLKKIRNNPKRHQHVMTQLKRYVELVKAGKVNGHKLADFVSQEMWDSIAAIQEKGVTFGRDI